MWVVCWTAIFPTFVSLQNTDPMFFKAFKEIVESEKHSADRVEMPPTNGEGPLEIELNLVVFQAGHVSELSQTFQVDGNLAISW